MPGIEPGNLVALAAATSLLVMIPGPNVALIVANSLRYGVRMGVATVLGTTLGVALQLLLIVFGLAALIAFAVDAFAWVRWAGVAYLVYLGIRTWRDEPDDLAEVHAAPVLFWRGCLIASMNPKTLLFNVAFIPQFVGNDDATAVQLGLVATVFLAVLLLGDILWATFAGSARNLLAGHARMRNRVSGSIFVAAGAGLALARNLQR